MNMFHFCIHKGEDATNSAQTITDAKALIQDGINAINKPTTMFVSYDFFVL
jgi:hypothetical protein